MSVAGLCRRAGVPVSTYWRVQTGRKNGWWKQTREKFERALDGEAGLPRSRMSADGVIRDLYRAYVVILAKEMGLRPEPVLASDPKARANTSPEWREAAHVRALAVYCVVTELGVPSARVGRAIGLTRAAVSQINKRVEDFRDDPKIDALVERVGALVSGRE